MTASIMLGVGNDELELKGPEHLRAATLLPSRGSSISPALAIVKP